MIYRVIITQNERTVEFHFDKGGTEAIYFAESCKKHSVSDSEVRVILMKDEEARSAAKKDEEARSAAKIGIIIDYIPAKECKNEVVRHTCLKCGKCGRVFEEGFMVDDGGTTVEDEE